MNDLPAEGEVGLVPSVNNHLVLAVGQGNAGRYYNLPTSTLLWNFLDDVSAL